MGFLLFWFLLVTKCILRNLSEIHEAQTQSFFWMKFDLIFVDGDKESPQQQKGSSRLELKPMNLGIVLFISEVANFTTKGSM